MKDGGVICVASLSVKYEVLSWILVTMLIVFSS